MQDSLNLVYITERSGCEIYDNLASFGEVFGAINEIRKGGVGLLENYAKLKNLEPDQTLLPQVFCAKNLQDGLIFAINYENTLCVSYEKICENLEDEGLRDLIFRLWATSNNEYIPALKSCLKDSFTSEQTALQPSEQDGQNLISSYQDEFAKISSDLEKIASGKASKEDVLKIINNKNFSFFSGLGVGALAGSLLAKSFEKTEE